MMGERMKGLLKDNKGSGLMMVMIGIAFISILGAVLLGAAYTNLRLKTLDSQARANFYTAETAMEEIKGALAEYSAEAMKKAYEKQIDQFLNYSAAEREELVKGTYFTDLQTRLRLPARPDKFDPALLESFTSNSNAKVADFSTDITSRGAIVFDAVNSKLTLKNVRVELTENELTSSITTDIVIGLPETRTDSVGYLDFALISDELVDIQQTTIANVNGGIYGGDKGGESGVQINNTATLNQSGDGSMLISRSDIKVSNGGKLTVANGELWTNNIVLGATDEYKSGNYTDTLAVVSGPSLEVNGTTNVKGDLYLNARFSNAVFRQAYYGYMSGSATNAASNSAIVINGFGSSLDMSDINELLVAGHSFVSGENEHVTTVDGSIASDVMEGESIATKKNETMYLVNSDYIAANVGSNPGSQNRVSTVADGTTPGTKAFARKIIKHDPEDDTKFIAGFESIYTRYLDADMPLKCYYTQNPKVVYFYLNFASEQKAEQYVRDYYSDSKNKETFDENLDIFLRSNQIKLKANGARYEVLGAAIANFNGGTELSLMPGQTASSSLPQEIQEKSDIYLSLTTFLRKYSGSDDARYNRGYVASVVNVDRVKADATVQTFTYPGGGGTKDYKYIMLPDGGTVSGSAIYLVDNEGGDPFEIREGMLDGIVFATGDVTLNSSYSDHYKGLVMACGKIYTPFGGTVNHEADPAVVADLFAAIDPDVLNRYFNEYPGGTTTSFSYGSYIGYENWVKDEDR